METNTNERIEFPFQLSQLALLNIRDENAFLSPFAIEKALKSLKLFDSQSSNRNEKNLFERNFPFYFHNYIIVNRDSISNIDPNISNRTITNDRVDFQIHSFNDQDQRKTIFNDLLKHFAETTNVSLSLSQKNLGQYLVDPLTLITANSLRFRPNRCEHWETLWSLKFHSNSHVGIETEFYYTKGFFPVAFDNTFQKIEILGETFQNLSMKMIVVLPRCSADLVHLYANIDEYLHRPMSSAYIGVCIPKISIDSDLNLVETLKSFYDATNNDHLRHIGESNEPIHLAAARSLGRFTFDIENSDDQQHLNKSCAHFVDLSPVTPWIFHINRPFLFFITYGEHYLFIGQMLGPKISKKIFTSKDR